MDVETLIRMRDATQAKLRLSGAAPDLATTLYKVLCHHGPSLPPGMRADICGALSMAGFTMRLEDMPWAASEAGTSLHIAIAEEDAL